MVNKKTESNCCLHIFVLPRKLLRRKWIWTLSWSWRGSEPSWEVWRRSVGARWRKTEWHRTSTSCRRARKNSGSFRASRHTPEYDFKKLLINTKRLNYSKPIIRNSVRFLSGRSDVKNILKFVEKAKLTRLLHFDLLFFVEI